LGYGLTNMDSRRGRLSKELALLHTQIEQLELNNEGIGNDIEYFSHPENLEKEARARLNLKSPGEKLIILTQRAQDEVGESGENERSEEKSIWEWLKSKLKL